jgi:hypothetical protein
VAPSHHPHHPWPPAPSIQSGADSTVTPLNPTRKGLREDFLMKQTSYACGRPTAKHVTRMPMAGLYCTCGYTGHPSMCRCQTSQPHRSFRTCRCACFYFFSFLPLKLKTTVLFPVKKTCFFFLERFVTEVLFVPPARVTHLVLYGAPHKLSTDIWHTTRRRCDKSAAILV